MDVAGPGVEIARMGEDDEQGRRRVQRERGRRQRRGRVPRTVDGRRLPEQQAVHHGTEAFRGLKPARQILQAGRHLRRRGRAPHIFMLREPAHRVVAGIRAARIPRRVTHAVGGESLQTQHAGIAAATRGAVVGGIVA